MRLGSQGLERGTSHFIRFPRGLSSTALKFEQRKHIRQISSLSFEMGRPRRGQRSTDTRPVTLPSPFRSPDGFASCSLDANETFLGAFTKSLKQKPNFCFTLKSASHVWNIFLKSALATSATDVAFVCSVTRAINHSSGLGCCRFWGFSFSERAQGMNNSNWARVAHLCREQSRDQVLSSVRNDVWTVALSSWD